MGITGARYVSVVHACRCEMCGHNRMLLTLNMGEGGCEDEIGKFF